MKKSVFVLLVSCQAIWAGKSFAHEADNWYIGGLYADHNLSIHDRDFKSAGIVLGYQYSPFFALESRGMWGTSGYDSFYGTPQDQQGNYQEDIDIQTSFYFKGMYPVMHGFKLYGLLGYTYTDFTVTSTGRPTSFDPAYGAFGKSDSDSSISYGLGLEYQVTDNINLFVDHVKMNDVEFFGSKNLDWDKTTIGFSYRF